MASLPSLESLTPLLKTFRQPTWLAVFTSAAMHGALFATSPGFSSSGLISLANPGDFNRPHTVPLIELTAEEQSRLPSFSSQSLSLFPELNQDELFDLSTTSPSNIADPFSSDLSSALLPEDWSRQIPSIPPLLPIDPNPNLWGLPRLPSPTPNPNSLPAGNANAPSTSESPPVQTTQVLEGESLDTLQTGAISYNPAQSSVTAAELSEVRPDQLGGVEDLRNLQIAGRTSGLLRLNPVAPGNGPELEPPTRGPKLSFNNPDRESLQARLQAYAYNAEGTGEEAASEAVTVWTAEIQDHSGIEDLQPTLVELSPIENPLRVCLPQAPTSVMIGVLINPEGRIVDPPRLLKSTGYGALNNWAAQSLGQYLEANGQSLESQDIGNQDIGNQDIGNQDIGNQDIGNQDIANPDIENQDLFQDGFYQSFSFEIPIDYDAESCVDRTRLTQADG